MSVSKKKRSVSQIPSTGNKPLDDLLQIMIRRFEHLVERGFLAPQFVNKMISDPDEICNFIRQNRTVVGNHLNRLLNPSIRPTPKQVEQRYIVPVGYFTNDLAIDMVTTSKSKLKNIIKKSVPINSVSMYMVYGYFRSNYVRFIPLEVQNICLLYFLSPDYFSIHGNHLTVNKNKSIIENNQGGFQTAYGSFIIDPNKNEIHQWTLKILSGSFICIGIDSATRWKNSWFYGRQSVHYAYCCCNGLAYSYELSGKYCSEIYQEGDIIKMVLDFTKVNKLFGTLSFSTHKTSSFIKPFGKIPKDYVYRLAICLNYATSVESINYCCYN